MKRPGYKKKLIYVALLGCGMGDIIASLPVCKDMVDNYSAWYNFRFWVPDFMADLFKLAIPNARYYKLSQLKEKYKTDTYVVALIQESHPTFLCNHLTEYAAAKLLDQINYPTQKKNYVYPNLQNIKLPDYGYDLDKGVIITPYYTSSTRKLSANIIDEISDYVISKGLIPVYVGKDTTQVNKDGKYATIKGYTENFDKTKGVDLSNKTSLTQLLKLMSISKVVVGLDNGLLHLAGMTDIPIVGGFTNVLPEHRMPYRHNQLGWNYYPVMKKLDCSGCQSNWRFVLDQSFTECYYGDYACVTGLTSNLFIEQLEKILK